MKKDKPGAKTCIALMDSGIAAAQLGVSFNGFALLGFEDSNHTVSMGLLDLVEGMVLVPEGDDPNPVYPPKETEKEDVETAGLKMLYNMSQQKQYVNFVESPEGYMMSLIDKMNNHKSVTNYFDLTRATILK